MLATVPNVGIRDTEMGKKSVLLSSVFTLSGKTHSIQKSISVSECGECDSSENKGEIQEELDFLKQYIED